MLFRGRGRGVERGNARVRNDVVADERRRAVGGDEFVCADAPVLLRGIASGRGLRRRDERQGRGVSAEEGLDGGWVVGGWGRSCDRLEHFQELGAGARGEERRRVGDDVGVFVGAEEEADGDAAGVGVGVVVGDGGDAGGVGEADPDGRGGVGEVGCAGELLGFC